MQSVATLIILGLMAFNNNNNKQMMANAQKNVPSPLIDICLQFSDSCPSCISTDSCGFCLDTGLCLTGDVNGPGGNPNNCTDWFFLECPTSPCSAFHACKPCVKDPLCGWCLDTLLCMPGSISGPITGTCRHFIFNNINLCNSPSPSRSRARRTTVIKRSKPPSRRPSRPPSRPPKTTARRTTAKPRTTARRIRTTARARPSHSPSPSNSLLATSPATFHQPIYLLFYILLALSSITIVVTHF